jgi:CheY-like chemotaxis protein
MTKILVADDDKVMLGLITTLMELEGNDVVTVTRPEQIVPTAEQEKPELILMDYHLSGGTSLEALKELKSSPQFEDVPVVVTSGMDRQTECLHAGATDFILKPFRPKELLDRLSNILDA